MSEIRNAAYPMPNLNAWGGDYEVVVCEHCQWRYLMPCDSLPGICPHCCRKTLGVMPSGLAEMPHPYPPELLAPFELSGQQLGKAIETFISSVPFPPNGLNAAALLKRLLPIYLPMWLVDSNISAQWQAEAGFDYEVVSHQEYYNGDTNHWESREVKEPRVRWEFRLGRIERGYQNVLSPALDDHSELEQKLGSFYMKHVLPFDSARLQKACVRLPDHPPQEAWDDAAESFQKAAAAECQQACDADRLRQFQWKARFDRLNWTLLLLPVYATYYQDEDGKTLPLLIHGQTGTVSGVRRASTRRAGRSSLMFFAAAVLVFLLGLLVSTAAEASRTLAGLSMFFVLVGFIGIIASSIPFIIAWDFNRRQMLEAARVKQAS